MSTYGLPRIEPIFDVEDGVRVVWDLPDVFEEGAGFVATGGGCGGDGL
jgi:cytochrome c-type biogenesis protein CcmE